MFVNAVDAVPGPINTVIVRGLRPQGVGSGGFNSLGMHWFLFALLVCLLVKSHDVYLRLVGGSTKEVHMNKNHGTNTTSSNTVRLLLSLINTVWAVGTSVVAGVLSA